MVKLKEPHMRLVIEVVSHEDQRYETCGDWQFIPGTWKNKEGVEVQNTIIGGTLKVTVSDTKNWKHAVLVGIHEFVEAVLCLNDGVSEQSVTNFDLEYEARRPAGDNSEPGDSPLAPYRKQHFIATTIERQLAVALGVDWNEYEQALYSLFVASAKQL